jgi:rhomboid protease GluP
MLESSWRRFWREVDIAATTIKFCAGLYVLSVLLSLVGMSGLSGQAGPLPKNQVIYALGASGAIPMFAYDRWWSAFSAIWLHGGILHVLFNCLWIYTLAPGVQLIYGRNRMVILFVLSGASGFLLSSSIGWAFGNSLGGAQLGIGASGAVFGLLGAMASLGKLTRDNQALVFAGVLFLAGLVMPYVDNWGHFGGFMGGLAVSRLPPMRPQRPETKLQETLAVCLYVGSLLCIPASLLSP